MLRNRVLISGRVQGVFFRDACRRMAEQHGVAVQAEPVEGLTTFRIE